MFKKLLIANRGEIAVRIIRTCREMGIETVALYTIPDRDSLHVRLADEAMPLQSAERYGDTSEVLALAKQVGADAIHPGYGFLAEEADFAERCGREGITFVGPGPAVTRTLRNKVEAMEVVKRAGYAVPLYAELEEGELDDAYLLQRAEEVGFPLVVKSACGGRGRGARVVMRAERLADAVDAARREAKMIFGDGSLYLERAIAPSHYVAVQILADAHGNMVHLGEREGSLLRHNQKLIEESPAPSLNDAQRQTLWQMALDIARLFNYQNAGAVEFLVDSGGNLDFTEVKARIQIEHAVSEMVSDVDIVREQVRIAAGETLNRTQADIQLRGWAMQCRINAEDPWNDYLPSPGVLTRFRLPQGPNVRVDTYGYAGCEIPLRYDPLLANLIVKGETRADCVQRMRRALQEFRVVGVQTNLPLHMQILHDEQFANGNYDTRFMAQFRFETTSRDEEVRTDLGQLDPSQPDPGQADRGLKDLAAMVAVAYALRGHIGKPQTPERIQTGWHRSARRLPV